MYQTPDLIFQELFTNLQQSGLFADDKVISDALPKARPEKILSQYRKEKNEFNFDLEKFFFRFFQLNPSKSVDFKSDTSRPINEHIEILWDVLKREADKSVEGGSLIQLPNPYIVPGGRFNEIYYWDSYFMMLGLQVSGEINLIENMVDNFSWLIEEVGFIPNGNRTYFLGRSQPPFYSLMINLLAEEKGEDVLVKYLPFLEKEYDFWMNGKVLLENDDSILAKNHVVNLGEGKFLNRYFDQYHQPRTEMLATDLELAEKTDRPINELFSNIRAACESGWDFSSRWLRDANDLTTIYTTEILPVDLNCLLYFLEKMIAKIYRLKNNEALYTVFSKLASTRKELILKYFWNKETGFFHDFDFNKSEQTNVLTMAGVFPLFFKIANDEQAKLCSEIIEKQFFKVGGLVTTLVHSGQQWDAPNGWAPLQWIGIQGLKNYGFDNLAKKISDNWSKLNTDVYYRTGKLLEKYNVEDTSLLSGGGEYEVQDGFGWTNGVLLKLMSER
jgi:alpha,alpha-trehalase